jgi:hypothetical protein
VSKDTGSVFILPPQRLTDQKEKDAQKTIRVRGSRGFLDEGIKPERRRKRFAAVADVMKGPRRDICSARGFDLETATAVQIEDRRCALENYQYLFPASGIMPAYFLSRRKPHLP